MNIYKRYRFPPEIIQHAVPKTFTTFTGQALPKALTAFAGQALPKTFTTFTGQALMDRDNN